MRRVRHRRTVCPAGGLLADNGRRVYREPSYAPGTSTVSMAWMMPLSHSTSAGQLDDLDGPSDLRPSMDFLPSMTWYLSTSAVIGEPTSLLCFSKAELDGARAVYSPPERSTPFDERAEASWSKLS